MNDRTEVAESTGISNSNREPVSALVDGELDAEGARFLLRRLADDKDMHRHWQRCHLVRACLQHEFEGPVSLVERVQGALESERAPQRASRMNPVLRFGLGGAIAASVAVVAVTALDYRMSPEQSTTVSSERQPDFVSQPTLFDRQFSAEAVPAGLGTGGGAEPAREMGGVPNRQRINQYMIRHSQAAGSAGFNSLMPVLTRPETVRLAPPTAEDAGHRSDAE